MRQMGIVALSRNRGMPERITGSEVFQRVHREDYQAGGGFEGWVARPLSLSRLAIYPPAKAVLALGVENLPC